ncbi:MAG: hypothetical protein AAB152_17260 [Candidatus Coatesbacteria bacterium]
MAAAAGAPQYVILKMDDLTSSWWREWKTLADLVKAEDLRIGFGIFAASLLDRDAAYDAWISGIARDDRYEIWFHGYTAEGPHGEPGREHHGTPYEYQKNSFDQAREVVLTRCDRILRTFGEHWHGGDATTVRIFNEDPYYRVWLCAPTEGHGASIDPDRRFPSNGVAMEVPDPANWQPGYVNFAEFRREYAGHEADPYLILQGHPWSWTDTSKKPDRTGAVLDRWAEFRKIVAFLRERGAVFVTPYEYYRIARGIGKDSAPPAAPAGLAAAREAGALILRWQPADDSGIDCFKIYRDGQPVGLSITSEWRFAGGLRGSQRGSYSVVAVGKSDACSPPSTPVEVLPR